MASSSTAGTSTSMLNASPLIVLLSLLWEHIISLSLPPPPLLLALSVRFLGYGVVFGSLVVKVPQLIRVYRAKSAKGLALTTFELETVGYTVAALHSFHLSMPFSACGECLFLLVQDATLLVMLYMYQKTPTTRILAPCALYAAFVGALALAGWPMHVLATMHASTSALFVAARVPQIVTNAKQKSTGELSLISVALNWLGNLARIFTTMQSQAAASVLVGHVLGTMCNGVLLAQILLFKPKKKKAL